MENTVYTAADANYELQARVLLKSLSLTQTCPTHLIVFGANWSQDQVTKLEALAEGNVSVEIREVNQDLHRDIRLTNGFPLATAYNILAPKEELPGGVRALYVDADVVVRKDLGELFTMKMNHVVGAVVDAHVAVMGIPSMWRPWREEGIDPTTSYLNTGALLVEVDAWRNFELTEKILELLRRYELPCVDQDAINLVLRGEFDRLRPSFNSMPYHLMKLLRNADLVETDDDLNEAITDPSIVHYHRSFLGKPWTRWSTHPARHLWTDLADLASPKWKRTIDAIGTARGIAARAAKMSTLDDRSEQMKELKLVEVSN